MCDINSASTLLAWEIKFSARQDNKKRTGMFSNSLIDEPNSGKNTNGICEIIIIKGIIYLLNIAQGLISMTQFSFPCIYGAGGNLRQGI